MRKILKRIEFPKQRATVPLNVLLLELENEHHPFVTYLEDRSTGATFWGHYFRDQISAELDFEDRAEDQFDTCRKQGLIENFTLLSYRMKPSFPPGVSI